MLKTFEDHYVRRCLNFIFWKYHGWTLRNEKVIRYQATGSMSRKFGNHEFFQNIDAGEGFRPLNSWNSLAGAISMPCGAPTYHFKWLVEWLHRRLISSAGAIARRKVVVQSMRFRTLTMVFVTINDVCWKLLKIIMSAGVWISFSESITAGRCEMKKLYVTKQPAPWAGNLEIMNFSKILTLVRGSGL